MDPGLVDTAPPLHSIPDAILTNEVFTRLCPQELFRLAACSRHLLRVVTADAVWQPLCDARAWGPYQPGCYMAGFAARQRTLCVECQQPTPYVYQLLGCRLCEACEHQNARYALVTALEAEQRYGANEAALQALRSVTSCDTQFYLRDAVIQLVGGTSLHGHRTSAQGRSIDPAQQGEAAEWDEEQEQDSEEEEGEEEEEGGCTQEGRLQARGCESSGGRHSEEMNREEQKAARKAAKKQAKLEQRLRREAKAAGALTPQPSRPARGKRASRSGPRLTKSSQHAAARHAGLHQGLYPDEDTGLRLLGASPKAKSEWLVERENIMREYGQFAISGLVLA